MVSRSELYIMHEWPLSKSCTAAFDQSTKFAFGPEADKVAKGGKLPFTSIARVAGQPTANKRNEAAIQLFFLDLCLVILCGLSIHCFILQKTLRRRVIKIRW